MSYTIPELEKMDFSDIMTGEKLKFSYHPGQFLKEEFLEPLGITEYRLAKDIGVDPKRIYNIIQKQRAITVDTAIRLEKYLGISKEMWMGLQMSYDFDINAQEHPHAYDKIQRSPKLKKSDSMA